MSKKSKNLISRDKYKEIKRMDHTSMSEFYTKVWQEGFDNGVKAGNDKREAAVTPEDIREVIKNVKGIGETKIKAIMEQIGTLYK
nr:MAG TPA: DNA excision repair protein [Caudoviricetes sp.]